jgi:hypothetical protein
MQARFTARLSYGAFGFVDARDILTGFLEHGQQLVSFQASSFPLLRQDDKGIAGISKKPLRKLGRISLYFGQVF